jgi:Na+/proline symporter
VYILEHYLLGLGATFGVPLLAALFWGRSPTRAALAVVISAILVRVATLYPCAYYAFTSGTGTCQIVAGNRVAPLDLLVIRADSILVFVVITAVLAYGASAGVGALRRKPKPADDR